VDGWNQLIVSGSEEYRRSKGAGHHLTAGCLQDQSLCCSLFGYR
jgi:hypothetical protein